MYDFFKPFPLYMFGSLLRKSNPPPYIIRVGRVIKLSICPIMKFNQKHLSFVMPPNRNVIVEITNHVNKLSEILPSLCRGNHIHLEE